MSASNPHHIEYPNKFTAHLISAVGSLDEDSTREISELETKLISGAKLGPKYTLPPCSDLGYHDLKECKCGDSPVAEVSHDAPVSDSISVHFGTWRKSQAASAYRFAAQLIERGLNDDAVFSAKIARLMLGGK